MFGTIHQFAYSKLSAHGYERRLNESNDEFPVEANTEEMVLTAFLHSGKSLHHLLIEGLMM